MGFEGLVSVPFSDLLGEHELSGVDFGSMGKMDKWSDESGTMDFIIDGKIYSAIEDPGDGYRSSLEELAVGRIAEVKNKFPSIMVIGSEVPSDQYVENNIIQFIDCTNGKVVMRLGTGNTNDYYPFCVMEFTPENMSTNEKGA